MTSHFAQRKSLNPGPQSPQDLTPNIPCSFLYYLYTDLHSHLQRSGASSCPWASAPAAFSAWRAISQGWAWLTPLLPSVLPAQVTILENLLNKVVSSSPSPASSDLFGLLYFLHWYLSQAKWHSPHACHLAVLRASGGQGLWQLCSCLSVWHIESTQQMRRE